eukprot:scaffold545261_cov41-Prasinocladus_malaysianus.AAC.1
MAKGFGSFITPIVSAMYNGLIILGSYAAGFMLRFDIACLYNGHQHNDWGRRKCSRPALYIKR